MKAIIIFSLLFSTAFVTGSLPPPAPYKLAVLGGGISGLSSLYFAITRGGEEANKTILIEKETTVGGNYAFEYVAPLPSSGVTGSIRNSVGPQRVPQNTLPYQRALLIELNITTEFVTWNTRYNARGRTNQCAAPNETAYSPTNVYGWNSLCADVPAMSGDPAGLDNTADFGPAFWFDRDQATVDETGTVDDAASFYLVGYTSLSPVDGHDCVLANPPDCPSDVCYLYADLYTFLQALFGREYTNEFIESYLGFYSDFFSFMLDPCGWLAYWAREYDTTSVYGYMRNSSYTVIEELERRVTKAGSIISTDETVLRVDYIKFNDSFAIKTNKRVFTAKKVIFSFPPNQVILREISGNVPLTLINKNELRAITNTTSLTVYAQFEKNYTDGNGDPAFFWQDPSVIPQPVVLNANVSRRHVGDEGCFSRVELLGTRDKQNITGSFRVTYTDYLCHNIFRKYKDLIAADRANGLRILWERISIDLAANFGVDVGVLPTPRLIPGTNFYSLNISNVFNEAWHFYGYGFDVTINDIQDWFTRPIPQLAGKFCWAHQSAQPQEFGWSNAGIRAAMNCTYEFYPCTKTKDVFQKWIANPVTSSIPGIFPECLCPGGSGGDCCYENSDTGTGLPNGIAMVIPGLDDGGVTNAKFYCSERWWTHNFEETPGCVQPTVFPTCTNS